MLAKCIKDLDLPPDAHYSNGFHEATVPPSLRMQAKSPLPFCSLFNNQTTSPSLLWANSQRGAILVETLKDCSPKPTIKDFKAKNKGKTTGQIATRSRLFSIGE